jgi:triacylglycerol lipase
MRVIQVALIIAVAGLASPALAHHNGSAPVHPRQADDQLFVADTGAGLDTGCTFRNGGPLQIQVKIERYLGETQGDGTLANVAALKEAGVVAEKARIRFPAFDIDSSAVVPPYAPEVDYVSFNGHRLERNLTGVNDGWVLQEFEVPIEWVKFSPARGAPGSKPAPAFNELRIDIDQANTELVWCMAVDWVEIEVKSMAPLLLVHGITGDPTTWDTGARQYLERQRIPHDPNIQLGPNDSVDANGRLLASIARERAISFGAQRAHLVVHSKGGKDSTRYLSTYYDPETVKILSLHTLSTPHFGSIHADLAIAAITEEEAESDDPDVAEFLSNSYWANTFGAGPQRPGLDDLQTGTSRAFVASNPLPGGVILHTFGADADLDDDGAISHAEARPLLDDWRINEATVGTNMYRLLRNVASITVTHRTSSWGLNEWDEVTPTATATPQDNDLSVTDTSSHHPQQRSHTGPYDRNHSNIKDAQSLTAVMAQIRTDFPLD